MGGTSQRCWVGPVHVMRKYVYCPGNMGRYDLRYGTSSNGTSMIAWMKRGGSGGVCFIFDTKSFVALSYLCEKMDIGHGDGRAILAFLQERGHDTSDGRDPSWRGDKPSLEIYPMR
jgi:hypothetical protein